jgi:putative transcriptional regulator
MSRKYPHKQPSKAERGIGLTKDHRQEEYAYLKLPPHEEMRSCVGLVLAGVVARARVGVGSLEEAVEVLESFHADDAPTRFRFSLAGEGVLAEVEEPSGEGSEETRWRTVVEMVS